ncbi:MAG: glucosamine-6-phosphate deaminase [Cyclobacteriaceae bacterium]|nr:glucosamine-6-phosphate deaminase [Cyclobacteriaceae bacterium]
MSEATAQFIAKYVKTNPESLLCFPSGDSPTGTLEKLVQAAQRGDIDFSRCWFVGLDEWVGMDKHDHGSCQQYIYMHLFDKLKLPAERIRFFDAKASDLNAECEKVDRYIFDDGPLDIIVVGVGLNGHIGLNEPGSSFTSYSHVVDLAESTKTSGQKYFSQETKLEKGITIGIQHMMEAKTVVVIASGEKKADIIQKIAEGEITENIPGSILQKHPNCHLFLDRAAASRLSRT